MTPRYVTLDSRGVRIAIAFGAAFIVWIFCASRLNHRCLLGYKWFEHYSPLVVAALAAAGIIFCRSFRLGIFLAATISIAFLMGVIPAYLDWIHGPDHPSFPDAEARISTNLRLLDDSADAIASPANLPQTPHR